MTVPLVDQIRARIAVLAAGRPYVAADHYERAVTAVLELHALVGEADIDGHVHHRCRDCHDAWALDGHESWPCPTVTAIAAALSIDTAPAAGAEVPQ